jgi:transcriptional regulator with XRE-family HTH domain
MKNLGKKIRLLRHQRGWSQEDVAKRLDISIPAFSKIETGITDVNLSRLDQISQLFDLSIVQLLTYNDAEDQKKYNTELELANARVKGCEDQIIALQKKVIDLYEELRKVKGT